MQVDVRFVPRADMLRDLVGVRRETQQLANLTYAHGLSFTKSLHELRVAASPLSTLRTRMSVMCHCATTRGKDEGKPVRRQGWMKKAMPKSVTTSVFRNPAHTSGPSSPLLSSRAAPISPNLSRFWC